MQKFTCLPGEKMKNPSICAKVNKKKLTHWKKKFDCKNLSCFMNWKHMFVNGFFFFSEIERLEKTAKENSTRASEENLLFDRLHTGKSLQAAASAAIRLVKKVGEK